MYYDRQVIRTTGEALATLLYLGSTSVYHNISDLSICIWIILVWVRNYYFGTLTDFLKITIIS